MARLKITTNQTFLRQVSKPVTDFGPRLHTLLDDMRETLDGVMGAGLAAVQVNVLWRAAIVKNFKGETVETTEIINPIITAQSNPKDGEEACLSLPNESHVVRRNQKVTVKAFDRFGKEFTKDFEGLGAVCVQHEIDHMDGILYTDRIGGAPPLRNNQNKIYLENQARGGVGGNDPHRKV